MKLLLFSIFMAGAQFGYIVALHKHGIALARWDVLGLLLFALCAVWAHAVRRNRSAKI